MGCGVSDSKKVQTTIPDGILSLNKIYQRKELIGSGSYGKVYRCVNKLNNMEYALKVVEITAKNKDQAIKQIANLKAEIGVLKKLNHQNIVKYYSFDISEDNKQVEIVLQYAKFGCLKSYIQKNGSLSEEEASSKTAQILAGLSYLHDLNIVHRDLKCANILIMEDGTLKISDFGTAKHIKVSNTENIAKMSASLKGTPYYMAPQILRRTGHTISADIWSLGCLVVQMLSGRAPWTSLTNNFQEIISYIISGIHPPFPKGLTDQCQCFLSSCLDNVPSQRLTAPELLKHRWIDGTQFNRSKNQIKHKYSALSKTNVEDSQYSDYREQINDKRRLKEKKNQQIDHYISQKKQQKQKKKGGYRTSAKGKKEKSTNIVFSAENPIEAIDELQIVPNLPISRKLFQDESTLLKKDLTNKNVKTAPQVKLSEQLILEMDQIQNESIQVKKPLFNDQKFPTQKIDQNSHLKTEHSVTPQGMIDTLISREERNRYLQVQKTLRQQREQEKRKWQRQLKQGANYLRKQISSRYIG